MSDCDVSQMEELMAQPMPDKLEEYKEKFIAYFTDLGFKEETARCELEGQIENVGIDELDYKSPEFDAQECLSYWDFE